MKGTYNGCKLTTPNRCDKAPVMKGTMAVPIRPKLVIQPIDPDNIWPGINLPHWFMIIGNMGPKNRPTSEMATASPTREGTRQMTISRLEMG